MLNILSRWIRRTASDVYNVIVGLILVAILPLIYFYADWILSQTTKVLSQPLPLWVMVSTTLGVLLICLLFLKKTSKNPKAENKKIQLDKKAIEMLRTIATIENPLKNQDKLTINQQFLADTLELSPQKTKYYLEQLNSHELIIYTIYNDLIGLTAEGRAYLNNNKIIP